jgi:lysine 6-dehydrogenase
MKFFVLGAGMQGYAAALDLARADGVAGVVIADVDLARAESACERLRALPERRADVRAERLDVSNEPNLAGRLRGFSVVVSAVPYFLNLILTRAAIEAGASFCDLGGNTDLVREQERLDAKARDANVTIVPDCGLAPGLVNILAEAAIRKLDSVDSCRLFVGGLPQKPEPPLNYQLVYSLEGVLDYYTTDSWVLEGGRPAKRAALSELEMVEFDAPLGKLEAFHTAGGLSTMSFKYEGKIGRMEYKTLRYPGHAKIMESLRDLGFFASEEVDVKGVRVKPRDLVISVLRPKLDKPRGRDLVALRVVCEGKRAGQPARAGFEMVDCYDEVNGVSAMMRTTGYSLSVTAQMQVRKEIAPAGVWTPDECVPADKYLAALARRGIQVRAI